MKEFTKKEKKKIYKFALKHFISINKNRSRLVFGMCNSINIALSIMHKNDYIWVGVSKKYLPEFYTFKPKKTWKEDQLYWFTRNVSEGGYDIRVSILTALSKGQSVEQWEKEWKTKNNKK